ncbi:MAG TPA: carboxypeptidase-like regulatory domain-containing protein [Kofleriaceae bacterium]|nr:carboxypeptidase-like regulatory domain-containing protein [Kofleriaceae bacterium]
MVLRPCPSCRRHVDADEPRCPFCRGDLTPAAPRALPVGRVGRAAVFAGATLATTGCWTSAPPPRTTPVEHVEAVHADSPLPVGTIRGVVRDSGGTLLSGYTVYLRWPSGETRATTSNANGEYVFGGLPPGRYAVEYRTGDPRQPPASLPVELTTDTGARRDLEIFFVPYPDTACCKPYGAPPARRRIV